MSNLFSGINARFRGSKSPGPGKSPTSSSGQPPVSPLTLDRSHGSQSPASAGLSANLPPLPKSPSLAQTIAMDEQSGLMAGGYDALEQYHLPRPMPLWLNPNYAKHIVKGNFMTLSARPKTVEQGEWIAHQDVAGHIHALQFLPNLGRGHAPTTRYEGIGFLKAGDAQAKEDTRLRSWPFDVLYAFIEHYRNLWNFVRVIHEKEEDGSSICNPNSCPRMSAGQSHSFTWLNSRREPVELPAYEYITLMQRWISGKIDDTRIFPTEASGVSYAHNSNITTTPLSQLTNPGEPDWVGKRSGFPQNFVEVCQTIFRQMFRVYSHLYWAHFVEPFYHLNLEKQLNSCFSHFILTATALDMLRPHELEPMQPLIDLWAASGTFPPESKAYEYANLNSGQKLLQLGNASSAQ